MKTSNKGDIFYAKDPIEVRKLLAAIVNEFAELNPLCTAVVSVEPKTSVHAKLKQNRSPRKPILDAAVLPMNKSTVILRINKKKLD